MRGLRARRRDRLLELDEVERRLKPFGRYLGVREIPFEALVGTDSRASSSTRSSGTSLVSRKKGVACLRHRLA
jgi:hypothetical protein